MRRSRAEAVAAARRGIAAASLRTPSRISARSSDAKPIYERLRAAVERVRGGGHDHCALVARRTRPRIDVEPLAALPQRDAARGHVEGELIPELSPARRRACRAGRDTRAARGGCGAGSCPPRAARRSRTRAPDRPACRRRSDARQAARWRNGRGYVAHSSPGASTLDSVPRYSTTPAGSALASGCTTTIVRSRDRDHPRWSRSHARARLEEPEPAAGRECDGGGNR